MNKLKAYEIVPSTQGKSDSSTRLKLGEWLSDWHLISFLGTVGLFTPASFFRPVGVAYD